MRFSTLITTLIATGISFSALSQVASYPIEKASSGDSYKLVKVAEDVSIPWGMVWLSKSEALVTDRKGELRMLKDGKLLDAKIEGLPKVDARNQGGLLDIEKHPEFAKNGWLYISYSGFEGEGEGSNTSVIRAKLDKAAMKLIDVELLFDGEPNTDNSRHFGSRLEFDNDGYLFISVGDRGDRDTTPQRLDYDGGKVHRINDDGSVPKDNPFVGQKDANDTIFSYGHRNPQGMAKHPKTGAIWAHEHGPRGGDELNLVSKGNNYGWPVISYGINYNGSSFTDITAKEGMVQPKWQWTPSIAPSGMVFVTSDRYPEWKGHMLIGSLKFAHLVLVKMDGENVIGHEKLFEGVGRVRSVSMSPDGYVYIGTDGAGIYKVEPKA